MSSVRAHGWSLQGEAWRQLIRLHEELSLKWQRTVLSASHHQQVPARPGVYAIEFASPLQLGAGQDNGCAPIRAPIYVGKSITSIRGRFYKHAGDDPQDLIALARQWPNLAPLPRVFSWAEVSAIDAVSELESRLIECFNPPCNKIGGLRLSAGRPAGAL